MTFKKKKRKQYTQINPQNLFNNKKKMRALTQLQIVKQTAACVPLYQNKVNFNHFLFLLLITFGQINKPCIFCMTS